MSREYWHRRVCACVQLGEGREEVGGWMLGGRFSTDLGTMHNESSPSLFTTCGGSAHHTYANNAEPSQSSQPIGFWPPPLGILEGVTRLESGHYLEELRS